jgi:hypothetical protein
LTGYLFKVAFPLFLFFFFVTFFACTKKVTKESAPWPDAPPAREANAQQPLLQVAGLNVIYDPSLTELESSQKTSLR